jgi:mannose-6-phosphate isomerase-like protein (cupin superfamily)
MDSRWSLYPNGCGNDDLKTKELNMSTKKDWHVTVDEAIKLTNNPADPGWGEVMVRGSLIAGLYKPNKIDEQTPHDQDEVYFVHSGTGEFINNGERVNLKPGDFLFVPAFAEHRFENFSDDFSVWVVFYGVKGGEKV